LVARYSHEEVANTLDKPVVANYGQEEVVDTFDKSDLEYQLPDGIWLDPALLATRAYK
jgi:hypothetical protein